MHDQINRRLEALLSECTEPLLREVMSYCVLGAGKRTRPLLLLAACEALSGNWDDTALDFACAVEMIHAYSLAHDDLPAMDNDDFRRGRPTCHKAYSEAMAILAGDGLLSLAVEVMARRVVGQKDQCPSSQGAQQRSNPDDIEPIGAQNCFADAPSNKNNTPLPHRAALALNCIVKAAGTNGMVAGQVSDIINEGKPIDAETLAAIHRRKTGCLIAACFEAGAILAGGDRAVIQKMAELGATVGLAFQIRDDILDVTSTAESLGKPIGSDSKNQKATYVSVHGLQAAEAEYQRLSQAAFEIIDSIPCKTHALREVISQTVARTK